MLNNICLVGVLDEGISDLQDEQGCMRHIMILRCVRPFRDSEGLYQEDLVPFEVWNGAYRQIMENNQYYTGFALRGRLETGSLYDEKGAIKYTMHVIGEQITRLPRDGASFHNRAKTV